MITETVQSFVDWAVMGSQADGMDYVVCGVKYCGKCHSAKQHLLSIVGMPSMLVPCLCKCEEEKREMEKEMRRQREENERIQRLKDVAMTDPLFQKATFENDDGRNPEAMSKLQKYAVNFEVARKSNIGLCILGDVGTGKSYAAACIANYVMDRGTPTIMTNLSKVLNALSGFEVNKNEYINSLVKYPLLVIDDFGIERSTEYALEQVYNVIDARYRACKPLIITTNLTWEDIKNPLDLNRKRIYSRIVEMCTPVNFGTQGRRKDIATHKRKIASGVIL